MKTSKSRQFLDGNYFVAMGSRPVIKKFFCIKRQTKTEDPHGTPWNPRK
jgi:hypothetical protein